MPSDFINFGVILHNNRFSIIISITNISTGIIIPRQQFRCSTNPSNAGLVIIYWSWGVEYRLDLSHASSIFHAGCSWVKGGDKSQPEYFQTHSPILNIWSFSDKSESLKIWIECPDQTLNPWALEVWEIEFESLRFGYSKSQLSLRVWILEVKKRLNPTANSWSWHISGESGS